MAKVACPQCNNQNSSYIRWCLNCGAYCADDFLEPESTSRAVDELFASPIKCNSGICNDESLLLSSCTDKGDEQFSPETSPVFYCKPQVCFESRKKGAPPLVHSKQNPYYSNKRELEDYMRSSFGDWDGCYQSITLRQSFKADDYLYELDEPIVEPERSFLLKENDRQPSPNDFIVEENDDIEAISTFKLSDDIGFTFEDDLPSAISVPSAADYSDFFHLTPRISVGDESLLIALPSEMLLYILSLLSQSDLVNLMLVCKKLKRFASDSSLWRSVILRNRQLRDEWMLNVAQRKPQSLAFVCCDGADLSSSALAEMFRYLQNSLVSFTLRASSRGALDTDNVVLRLAGQCGQNVTKLNVAWSALTDVGLAVIGCSFPKLLHLDLSGCRELTNKTVCAVITSIGRNLRTLVLCQNSNLTEITFETVAANCASLQHLELNSFPDLNDIHVDAICNASSRSLRHLGLENCKKLTVISIVAIGESCAAIESLNLGNNRQLSKQSVHVIAEQLQSLKSLNLNRIVDITDEELMLLSKKCPRLQSIDLSRLPKITSEGVLALIATCPDLRAISLTGCSKINDGDKHIFKKNSGHSIAVVI